MFSGIIKEIGLVKKIDSIGKNKTFWIESTLAPKLNIDQSVAHNGVCLTVESIDGNQYQVTAIDETLKKTNLGDWLVGDFINLETSLTLQTLIDGHLVQGHVDGIGICESIIDEAGSKVFRFIYPSKFESLLVEKGSITVNGVSLTAFECVNSGFSVGIIPYTYQHTNFKSLKVGSQVNLEFDIIGKYISRMQEVKNNRKNETA